MKKIIRDLTPPLLWRALGKIKSSLGKPEIKEWEYVPEGWAARDNNPKIKGWNVDSVLSAYKVNWASFTQNLAGTSPFGFSPESSSTERTNLMFQNIIMIYAYALALASRHKHSISLLDWGGAIGHYYPISQKLIPDLKIDYHCKDVPVLAEYGGSLFPDAHFYSDESCLEQKYDLIFASGSLQYTQDWAELIAKFAQATKGYLFVTRFPVVEKSPSFVIVQRPYQYGYDTEYIGGCVNRQEFINTAENNSLTLVREFIAQESPYVHNAPEQPKYYGFLFKKSD